MEILGVRIDNLSRSEILGKIGSFFSDGDFHQIATVNPEFVLEAQGNEESKTILNSCDLNIADGFGITLAFLRYGRKLKCRLTGADLLLEILSLAEKKKLRVFLAINKNGLSDFEEIRKTVSSSYPGLEISGADLDPKDPDFAVSTGSCDILLCNFGHPEQEAFIWQQKNARISLGMGVGGSFDYLTGMAKRAPLIMRRIGLEWLWRLLVQPKRWRRIRNAVVVFPIRIAFSKNNAK